MCGCRKNRSTATASRTTLQRTTLSTGILAADPFLIGGEVEGMEPVRVRVNTALPGLTIGQRAWVTGTGVEPLLADGTLILVGEDTTGRLYRVGAYTYTSFEDAELVSQETGMPVEEVA